MRNEEVLRRVKDEMNILLTIKKRKANLFGHILRRNCLLKHIFEGQIEGRIEVTGRRERRCKQPMDHLRTAGRYCKLKAEVLDCTLWRNCYGRSYGTVVRVTTD
jgi:hypothetical protein